MSYQQHYDVGADPELAELLTEEKIDPSTLSALYAESTLLLQQQNQRINKLESLLFLLLGRNGMMDAASAQNYVLNQNNGHHSRRRLRTRYAYNDGQRYDNEEISFSR